MFIGSFIFEYTGAFIRWLFCWIFSLLFGKKRISWKEILNGADDYKGADIISNGWINISIGLLLIGGVCALIEEMGW